MSNWWGTHLVKTLDLLLRQTTFLLLPNMGISKFPQIIFWDPSAKTPYIKTSKISFDQCISNRVPDIFCHRIRNPLASIRRNIYAPSGGSTYFSWYNWSNLDSKPISILVFDNKGCLCVLFRIAFNLVTTSHWCATLLKTRGWYPWYSISRILREKLTLGLECLDKFIIR